MYHKENQLFYVSKGSGLVWWSAPKLATPRVQIPAILSFFAVLTATMLRWQPTTEAERRKPDVWGLNEGGGGKIRWIDWQAKVEQKTCRKKMVRFESDLVVNAIYGMMERKL